MFATGGYGVEVDGVLVRTYDEYRLCAMRAAMVGGEVVYLTVEVEWTRGCTVGPSAVTGERCGAPAVTTFTGRDGGRYAECAEHAR